LDDFPGVAARTEPEPFATEGEQVLVTAIRVAPPSESLAQIFSFEIISNHITDNRAPVSISGDLRRIE
jgi:hypothetical protein